MCCCVVATVCVRLCCLSVSMCAVDVVVGGWRCGCQCFPYDACRCLQVVFDDLLCCCFAVVAVVVVIDMAVFILRCQGRGSALSSSMQLQWELLCRVPRREGQLQRLWPLKQPNVHVCHDPCDATTSCQHEMTSCLA